MKITNISVQQRDANRVNVSVDGRYRLSLDISQIASLGVRVGREYTASELDELEQESQFGKLYGRALEYCLMRPHSSKEVKDYLWKKTRTTKYRSKRTGEIQERAGVSQEIADRVFEHLELKTYADDESFARYWVEYRNQTKGISRRKLEAELKSKGVSSVIIGQCLANSSRNDSDEIRKIIIKKQSRYPDQQKLIQYLARQGFSYDDITSALSDD